MRKLTNLLAITLLSSCATAFAQSNEKTTAAEESAEIYASGYDKIRFIVAFNVHAGHLIVPVGLTNTHHEPINFFGTSRPEGERTLLFCRTQPGTTIATSCPLCPRKQHCCKAG